MDSSTYMQQQYTGFDEFWGPRTEVSEGKGHVQEDVNMTVEVDAMARIMVNVNVMVEFNVFNFHNLK